MHRRSIDGRYVGQAFQLTFEVPQPMSRRGARTARVPRDYRRRYGHDHQEAMEVVNLRSTAWVSLAAGAADAERRERGRLRLRAGGRSTSRDNGTTAWCCGA